MGTTERPVDVTDQDEQAAHLRGSEPGPTAENEAVLLEAEFGHPNSAGVYPAAPGGELA